MYFFCSQNWFFPYSQERPLEPWVNNIIGYKGALIIYFFIISLALKELPHPVILLIFSVLWWSSIPILTREASFGSVGVLKYWYPRLSDQKCWSMIKKPRTFRLSLYHRFAVNLNHYDAYVDPNHIFLQIQGNFELYFIFTLLLNSKPHCNSLLNY